MRLADHQRATIRETVRLTAGADVCAYVFGSRLDDSAKGGDLDLLLSADRRLDLLTRARVKAAVETAIGLPVDVVAYQTGSVPSAFQEIALARAVLL
jgi:predicted nucleotidyltransferase